MTRDELLAALEAATGPSRELDVEIAVLVYNLEPRPYSDRPRIRKMWYFERETDRVKFYNEDNIPKYTESINAALTLARAVMAELGHKMYEIHARLIYDGREPTAFVEITVPSREFTSFAHGEAAEARATVIAAIKARQS